MCARDRCCCLSWASAHFWGELMLEIWFEQKKQSMQSELEYTSMWNVYVFLLVFGDIVFGFFNIAKANVWNATTSINYLLLAIELSFRATKLHSFTVCLGCQRNNFVWAPDSDSVSSVCYISKRCESRLFYTSIRQLVAVPMMNMKPILLTK